MIHHAYSYMSICTGMLFVWGVGKAESVLAVKEIQSGSNNGQQESHYVLFIKIKKWCAVCTVIYLFVQMYSYISICTNLLFVWYVGKTDTVLACHGEPTRHVQRPYMYMYKGFQASTSHNKYYVNRDNGKTRPRGVKVWVFLPGKRQKFGFVQVEAYLYKEICNIRGYLYISSGTDP